MIRRDPKEKILELGGGNNPHPDCNCNVDVRPGPRTNFVADFNEPLPISSDEWDVVFSQFVIEHLSWRKTRQFILEMFRILKPGGRVIVITANTEAQLKYIQEHPQGWEGREVFDSASCILFGDNDYAENTHRNFMSPTIATKLFQEAGFEGIMTQPYGAIATDLLLQAVRPINSKTPDKPIAATLISEQGIQSTVPLSQLYDHDYFDGGRKVGGYREGYRDDPRNEIVFGHIMERKPESVLELGCGRGYILKRIEDMGIRSRGIDISKHAYMTRVASSARHGDICEPWGEEADFDLCFSHGVLEHIPEDLLPKVISQMSANCQRGLHGVTFPEKYDGFDKTKVTLKPRDWWERKLPYGHQVFDKSELEAGTLPVEYLKGDGKLKLNVGSFTTMFHHGWINMDVHDLNAFAQGNGYNYAQSDVRQGLAYQTASVDLIYMSHFFEHLNYKEGLTFLRECRRVIKRSGAMRIIVPDAQYLIAAYADCGKGPTICDLVELGEVNIGCAESPTSMRRLWAMLCAGHSAAYDAETLTYLFAEAGWKGQQAEFRTAHLGKSSEQILRETLDPLPCLSLFCEAIPA